MTQHELERLGRLERRRDYLKDKIFAQAKSKDDLPFVRAELSSLQWAIPIVRRYINLSDEERMTFWGTEQEEGSDVLVEQRIAMIRQVKSLAV